MIESLRRDVRAAFDARYVPSPGLADRVLSDLDRSPARRGFDWRPAAAVTVALVIVGALMWPALTDLALQAGIVTPPPALSLAAVTPDGQLWVVERDFQREPGPPRQTHNALFVNDSGGWHQRLLFDGTFSEMKVTGRDVTVVATLQQISSCTSGRGGNSYSCAPALPEVDVYRSTDAGRTWQHAPVPVSVAVPPSVGIAVQFSTAEVGWASIATSANLFAPRDLYATTDAGASWTRVGPLPEPARPTASSFVPGSRIVMDPTSGTGFLVANWPAPSGHSGLFETVDGGHSWREVGLARPAGFEPATMTLLDPRIVGATTLIPVAFREAGPDNATANDLFVYTITDGVAGPPRPVFTGVQNVRPVGDLVSMEVLDANHWWVTSQSPSAGDGVQARPAVAVTADGGVHWTIHEPAPRILFMTFSDAQHGYALAVEGRSNTNVILGTEDGGAHWSRVPVPELPR